MEQLTSLWPTLSGAIIVPLLGQLKKVWPNSDIPILWWGLQIVLSILLAFGLNWLYGAQADPAYLVQLATGAAVVATGTHAAVKTPGKMNGGQ